MLFIYIIKILRVLLKYLNTTSQVTSKKKSIKYNLPIQIGFFVYQYAKLRMLEFFFDVIDKFISRDDYCLLEMDTGREHFCHMWGTFLSYALRDNFVRHVWSMNFVSDS